MHFEKLNENKIRIILNNNDLKNNNIDLNFFMYDMAKINETNWPITVAMAPPATPLFNTNINIGSSIIFDIAPSTVANIAYLGLPSLLIEAFKPCPII